MVAAIKRLWHSEQGVQGAAALLVITMLLSNILGFLRDVVLANTLPLNVLDTYYAAFRIPDFLFNLFILGAISSAFIPVFIDLKTNDSPESAWRLAHNLAHTALLILFILGAGLFIFMPEILRHFLSGFPPQKIAATVPLARILLISPFFFSVSYVLGGVLNANKKFFAYSLAPLVYNLSIIIGGFLVPYFGVQGVAWSVVAGALAHALVQAPSLRRLGYRYTFVLQPFDAQLRKVFRLMLPRAISLSMTQLILLFFTRLASFLPSGTLSIFTLTNNFQTTPVAIFAASIGTAVFPMLGEAVSEKDNDKYRTLLTQSLKGMFFFMIPSMVLFWIFRAHIIRLYLALNHQTWDDTRRAITTFSWFIAALASQGTTLLMIRAFYARQNTRQPMIIAMLSAVMTILLAWYLSGVVHDAPALSLAFAIGTTMEAVTLVIVFMRFYPGLIDFQSLFKTIGVAVMMALAAGAVSRLSLQIVSEGLFLPGPGLGTRHALTLFIELAVSASLGLATYIGLAYGLKRNELLWLWPKRAAHTIPLQESEAIAAEESIV